MHLRSVLGGGGLERMENQLSFKEEVSVLYGQFVVLNGEQVKQARKLYYKLNLYVWEIPGCP